MPRFALDETTDPGHLPALPRYGWAPHVGPRRLKRPLLTRGILPPRQKGAGPSALPPMWAILNDTPTPDEHAENQSLLAQALQRRAGAGGPMVNLAAGNALDATATSLQDSGGGSSSANSPDVPSPQIKGDGAPRTSGDPQAGSAEPWHPRYRYIQPLPGGDNGPLITFRNDDTTRPFPYRPLTGKTASVVEDAARQLGVGFNVNSTSGNISPSVNPTPPPPDGLHAPNGEHYKFRAVDINRIGGMPVAPDNGDAGRLQEWLRNDPRVSKNFGPFINEVTLPDGTRVHVPGAIHAHRNHIHVSVME